MAGDCRRRCPWFYGGVKAASPLPMRAKGFLVPVAWAEIDRVVEQTSSVRIAMQTLRTHEARRPTSSESSSRAITWAAELSRSLDPEWWIQSGGPRRIRGVSSELSARIACRRLRSPGCGGGHALANLSRRGLEAKAGCRETNCPRWESCVVWVVHSRTSR